MTNTILKSYDENLRHSLVGHKHISDKYDFSNIKSEQLSELAENVYKLTVKAKVQMAEFYKKKTNFCHIDRIKGEIRFIRPYIIAQVIMLQNNIKYDDTLPPDFFVKNKTLYMVNTIAFNVPYGSNSRRGILTDFERVLYALTILESTDYKKLVLLKSKDYEFSPECIKFIEELNKNFDNEIISIQDLGIIEKDFDNSMYELIESINPEWKSGSIKTMEHANINLRENFNIFSNLEI